MKYAKRYSVAGHKVELVEEGGFRTAWAVAYRDLRTGYRKGRTSSNEVAIVANILSGGGVWVIHDTPNGVTAERK